MKLSKLKELHSILDSRSVLQHFIDSNPGDLFIGMNGVTNQIGINKDLDMKVRILLGIEIEKMDRQMVDAGIDISLEKKADMVEKEIETTTSDSGEENAD